MHMARTSDEDQIIPIDGDHTSGVAEDPFALHLI